MKNLQKLLDNAVLYSRDGVSPIIEILASENTNGYIAKSIEMEGFNRFF